MRAARFGVAVAVTVGAAVIQKVLWPFIPPSPELIFYPAVLVVARVAGLGPALFSVALSIPLLARWFLPPYGSWAVARSDDLIDLAIYAALASGTAWLVHRVRQSERQARSAAADKERALARLRAVVDDCPEGIVFAEDEGRVISCNPAAQAILGGTKPLSPDALVALFDVDGRPLSPEQRPLVRALKGERVTGAELRWREHDREVPLLVNAAPLPTRDGDKAAAVVIFQDVTHLKELDRLRTQWNAVVAHDLRQPINTILLYAQLLARKLRAAGGDAQELEAIKRVTRRLDEMVRDLSDASRLELRSVPLARRDVALEAFVAERLREARAIAPDRRFDLVVHASDAIASADPQRLGQIFDNLVSNAIKYGDAARPVTIAIDVAGAIATITISNFGDTLSPDDCVHMFERFRRTSAAVRKGIKGTGLGLFITRELVIAHGGEISCESADEKTTFRFTLPLAQRTAEAPLLH